MELDRATHHLIRRFAGDLFAWKQTMWQEGRVVTPYYVGPLRLTHLAYFTVTNAPR